MTEKRFEVTFNDSDFHLKDNETGEELKLVDEKVCYDYIADRWNALHRENEYLHKYNTKLQKQPLLFDVQTIPHTMEIMEVNTQLEKENEQLKQQVEDLEFELRTIKAFDRTVKEEHSDTVYDFQKKLKKW